MPGNTKIRYRYLGTEATEGKGWATLAREGDGVEYQIPIEWIPGNLQRGTILEVTTNDGNTVTFEPVAGSGPSISTAVVGG